MAANPLDQVSSQLPKAMGEWLHGSAITEVGDHYVVTPGQVLSEKERSLLSDRLGRLLGRRVDFSFTVPETSTATEEEAGATGTDTAHPNSAPADIEPGPDCPVCEPFLSSFAQTEASVARLSAEVAEAKERLRELESAAQGVDGDLESRAEKLRVLGHVQGSLRDWVTGRRDTFAWRLLLALSAEQKRAGADAEISRQWLAQGVDNFRPIPVGGTKPRRLLLSVILASLAIVGIVVFLLYLRRTLPGADLFLPEPPWIIGAGVLVWLGIMLARWFSYERADAGRILTERGENEEQQTLKSRIRIDRGYHGLMYLDFSRGLLVPLPWIVLAALGLNWLRRVLPVWVSEWLPAPWVVWTTAAVLYALLLIVATYRYYVGVSRLRGELRRLQRMSGEHRERYSHASREEARLKVLHSAVPAFLEALALPIHAPWLVDDSVVLDGGAHPDVERFPACVGLAYASGTDSQERPRMQALSRAALVSPGWISAAVSEVVNEVGTTSGASITLDSLDSDSGDSSAGARQRVIEKARDTEILTRIGRRRLRDLAGKVQISAVKEVKPQVRPLRDEGMGRLIAGTSRLLGERQGTKPWVEFLEAAMAPAAPFSLLTFTEASRTETPQRIARTVAIVPQDLEGVAKSNGFEVIVVQDDGSSPLDLVVRIDRSEWLDPRVLTIFDGATPLAVEHDAHADPDSSGPSGL